MPLALAGALSARETAGPRPPRVQITEIHYHPAALEAGHPAASGAGSEFVELTHDGEKPISIAGWKLTAGVRFEFPSGAALEPGESVVVCADTAAFRAAFGARPAVLGAFEGRLNNAGDMLRLEDATGRTITDLRFDDRAPWPTGADGKGLSLQRIDIRRDPDDPANWTAATPTPARPTRASRSRSRLSVFDVRHEPREPTLNEVTRVTCKVYHETAKPRVILSYESESRTGSVAMTATGTTTKTSRGRETTFAARIPPQAAPGVVKYTIQAGTSDGESATSPHADAPTPRHDFYVLAQTVTSEIPVYHLNVDPRRLRTLTSFNRGDSTVEGTLFCDGEVYENLQIRQRGAWARSWRKKSWKIIFAEGTRFRAQRRLNLNSCWRDASFLREKLAYEIYRDAGALSLKTRMVRVHVNGSFWGLFVEVEQPRRRFLKRHAIPDAILYKAQSRSKQSDERDLGTPSNYARHYELEVGDDESFRKLHRFCRDLAGVAADDLVAFFEARVDIPTYINYLCASALTQNWDAYNKNHFLAFDTQGSGKWYAIPWDLDRTLGDHWHGGFSKYNLAVLMGTRRIPGATGWNRLQERFFESPELTRRFFERLGVLLESTFTEKRLWPRIDQLGREIALAARLDRQRWGGGGSDFPSGLEGVKQFIADRRGFLRSELPTNLPVRPQNLSPRNGARVSAFPLVLRASEFQSRTRAALRVSRWQIREAGAGPSDLTWRSEATGSTLELPKGRLLPRRTYTWRVSYVDSNGKTSELSTETAFTTGNLTVGAVPFDLSGTFNRDLVANPGDPSTELVDANGGVLIVDGFDGQSSRNPLANGLPRNRRVGVHRLGDYDGPNALQLRARGGRPVTLRVRRGSYSFVRFLVTGGSGKTVMPVSLVYSDGTADSANLVCDDWYDDDPAAGGTLSPGSVPVLDGMDRIRKGIFKDRNDPAIFEVTLGADANKSLISIVLKWNQAAFQRNETTFNLFAVTGIRVD